MGAAATPPSPARAQAAPNTRVRTRATSAPRQSAISLFCATARMTSPARVVRRNSQHRRADREAEDDQEQPVARIDAGRPG